MVYYNLYFKTACNFINNISTTLACTVLLKNTTNQLLIVHSKHVLHHILNKLLNFLFIFSMFKNIYTFLKMKTKYVFHFEIGTI